MLRGSYSHITHFSKFILLLMLTFTFLLFSLLFGILALVPFYGSGVMAMLTSPDFKDVSVITAMKVIQTFNTAGGLLLPAFVYMWLCTPVETKFPGFSKTTSFLPLLLSVILIVIAQPVVGLASELNSHMALPEWLSILENWMKDSESKNEIITEAFLSTTTAGGLLANIMIIAVLPALAEEFIFRGALANLFKDWTRNIHVAVFISSFIFAAIHMQFYGFLPRFLLGMVLGYLYFWSGNLWLPVVAHFTNNFLTVMIEYLFRKGYFHTNAENFGLDNAAWLSVFSILAVSGTLYYIYKLTSRQGTKENGVYVSPESRYRAK